MQWVLWKKQSAFTIKTWNSFRSIEIEWCVKADWTTKWLVTQLHIHIHIQLHHTGHLTQIIFMSIIISVILPYQIRLTKEKSEQFITYWSKNYWSGINLFKIKKPDFITISFWIQYFLIFPSFIILSNLTLNKIIVT